MERTVHTPLRTALFESGKRQFVIARKAGIAESRFSRLVNGHLDATDDEKKRIARAMKCDVAYLFPEPSEPSKAVA